MGLPFATPPPPFKKRLHMAIATIQIEDGKGDFIVINASDFDPETMKEYKVGAAPKEAPAPKKKGRPKKAQ